MNRQFPNSFIRLTLLVILLPLLFSGCADGRVDTQPSTTKKLVIADQFGLAYAPIEILKATEILAEELAKAGLETTTIEFKTLGNTAAIREAMVSGDLDIGFVAIPPFLIGKDNGMDWRIISGVSESPMALVTKDPDLTSLSQLTSEHRIMLPQPGSVQHILLSMAAEKELKDPKAFDNQLIAMAHPDAMTAMLSGPKTQLHFTSPPYLEQELALEDFRPLVDAETIMGGPFTFIVGICPQRVHDDTRLYNAFESALLRAVTFMNTHPEEAAEILSAAYDYSAAELDLHLSNGQLRFDSEVRGLETFHEFMYRTGMIKNPQNLEDLYWRKNEN
ncbi:MAG: ABC transporter substrate-binding protein [Acidaminobacter sp.]|uniref:ABC transporter substrate-binding protein n=1 Tax=Acidaminobacter sp. TaxID=1872102 RepID=UPI001385920B|nr:ABC transporter substrate-binding protein [Acidaminobacter sp.]MZQ98050.1 ABC transporter substrate-binding protein [Acidaminobacter sp.]